MKITVRIDKIEIVVDEQGFSENSTKMKYSDQNERLQATLSAMVEGCMKLHKAKQETP